MSGSVGIQQICADLLWRPGLRPALTTKRDDFELVIDSKKAQTVEEADELKIVELEKDRFMDRFDIRGLFGARRTLGQSKAD